MPYFVYVYGSEMDPFRASQMVNRRTGLAGRDGGRTAAMLTSCARDHLLCADALRRKD
jgi:hypothetical protein